MDVASGRLAIPEKHGVDRVREFGVISLVNTTGIHPEVLEAILPCLLSTEPDLLIAKLFLAGTSCQVLKGGLLLICEPGV